jgi:hypothetical protein
MGDQSQKSARNDGQKTAICSRKCKYFSLLRASADFRGESAPVAMDAISSAAREDYTGTLTGAARIAGR